jgi:hypothetical protein
VLGIDPRAARATWTVILIALLCLTIYAIRNTLFILSADSDSDSRRYRDEFAGVFSEVGTE